MRVAIITPIFKIVPYIYASRALKVESLGLVGLVRISRVSQGQLGLVRVRDRGRVRIRVRPGFYSYNAKLA